MSRAQALACGMSARTIARRRASGDWIELLPGIYLVAGHRRSHEMWVRAASLWAGGRATVHGPSAAFWHGMRETAPLPVLVTVPRNVRRVRRAEIRVRTKDLAAVDRVELRGIGVTGRGLTVLETAAVHDDGPAFLDRALQRYVEPADLQAAYARGLGGHGMDRAGRLLVAAMDRADSALERRLLQLVRGAGVTGVVRGLPFQGWHIDIAFPDVRVAVEVDGWAWHVDRDGSAVTGPSRTPWSVPAGWCCGSPGPTSTSTRAGRWPRSGQPCGGDRGVADDRCRIRHASFTTSRSWRRDQSRSCTTGAGASAAIGPSRSRTPWNSRFSSTAATAAALIPESNTVRNHSGKSW